MMKKVNALIAVVLLLALATACGKSGAGKYKDGTYNGSGEGKNGSIKVEVLVEKGKIKSVKTLEHKETPGLSDPVFQKVTAAIVKEQSTEVDTVSGGTITSKGIMDAVKNALENAN
jgi:uncharacterized protein with FMN-binding domain